MQDNEVRNLSDIVGHSSMLEQMMRSVQAGRIVHALLFVGPHGTGKRTTARLFARAMLCTGKSEERPCGICPACKQFLNGTHPDVKVLAPEKRSIGVEEIRGLIDYLALRPYEGGRHVAIIEQADKMTPSAQNALLKTLESPPGDAAFFLLTETPSGLLPTIISRCQAVRFNGLTAEQCTEALRRRGIAPERAARLAELAQGSVGRALELDADEDYAPLRERVLNSLETLKDAPSIARAAQLLADDRERSAAVLETMELVARDLMQLQNGGSPYEVSDAARIEALGLNGSRLLEGVLATRIRLASNVQWISALEYMYFGLVG